MVLVDQTSFLLQPIFDRPIMCRYILAFYCAIRMCDLVQHGVYFKEIHFESFFKLKFLIHGQLIILSS